MTFQIGDKAYLHNLTKLPPIFETNKPLTVHGVLLCPHCGQVKLAVMSTRGMFFLNSKRFLTTEQAINQAIANEDYELAAKLRDERAATGTPT